MNEIDRRAFFASLLGAAVATGLAAKIPGLEEAIDAPVVTIDVISMNHFEDAVRYLRGAIHNDIVRAYALPERFLLL